MEGLRTSEMLGIRSRLVMVPAALLPQPSVVLHFGLTEMNAL